MEIEGKIFHMPTDAEFIEHLRIKNIEILSKEKKPSDLIEPFELRITAAVYESYPVTHSPFSVSSRIGGRAETYQLGNDHSSRISIQHPTIKEITFPGWLNLFAGDRIKAYVFRGKRVELEHHKGIIPYATKKDDKTTQLFGDEEVGDFVWHLEETLPEKISPIKIEKLGFGNEVMATYRDMGLYADFNLDKKLF